MRDPKESIIFIVFLLVVLFFLWLFTGGPARDGGAGPFIKPPQPLDTGETYGGSLRTKLKEEKTTSPFSKTVEIESATGAKQTDPQKEYISIAASAWNDDTIVVSGWHVKTPSGKKIVIGNAANIPTQGAINQESLIALEPGEELIITTGQSPLGVSFRENVCSGYLEQFQDFTPKIDTNCPLASSELWVRDLAGDSACSSFAFSVDRCEAPLGNIPGTVSPACHFFAQNDLNYNGCVALHRNDVSFFADRWRFFARENAETWPNVGGLIRLYDADGKLVDSLVY